MMDSLQSQLAELKNGKSSQDDPTEQKKKLGRPAKEVAIEDNKVT